MDYDWKMIESLLNIADKARQWPQLKPIHDAALAEMTAMIPAPGSSTASATLPSTKPTGTKA